jgi:hypothetical protein
MDYSGVLFRARSDGPEHILMGEVGALKDARDIARRDTENPAHMPRHVALMRETNCLRNLGDGQPAVQQ